MMFTRHQTIDTKQVGWRKMVLKSWRSSCRNPVSSRHRVRPLVHQPRAVGTSSPPCSQAAVRTAHEE